LTPPRKFATWAHRWIGLAVGLVFVFLGLTGSVLCFYPEIDRVLNPSLSIQNDRLPAAPIRDVLLAAQATYPDKFLHSIFLASDDVAFHQVWFTQSASDDSQMWEVMVHPNSAEVLGRRQAVPVLEFSQENLVNTIFTLHLLFFLGPTSPIFLGVIGTLLIVMLLLGLFLWWPRGRSWGPLLTLKRHTSSIRHAYDFHRVAGVYGLAVLLMLGVSGICLTLPGVVSALLAVEQPLPETTMKLDSANSGTLQGLEQAVALARARSSADARLKSIWMPSEKAGFWRVTLVEPGSVGKEGAPNVIFIDANTLGELSTQSYREKSAAGRFLDWQLPLHSGRILGLPGRFIVFLGGLLPLALFVTGLFIWQRKRVALTSARR